MKISTKLYFAFGLLVIISFINGAFTLYNISRTTNGFEAFTEVTDKVTKLQQLQKSVMKAQLAFENYIIQNDQKYIDQVNDNVSMIFEELEAISALLPEEEFQGRLGEAQTDIITFAQEFIRLTQVTQQISQKRNDIQELGTQVRQKMSDIMISATSDSEVKTSYYASRAQEHWMLARVYLQRFLHYKQESYSKRVQQELKETQAAVTRMQGYLQIPQNRKLATEIQQDITDYLALKSEIVDYQSEQQALISNMLYELGPRVDANLEALSSSILTITTQASDVIESNMSQAASIAWITTPVVTLVSMLVAYIFGAALRKRLYGISNATQELANGELNSDIPDTEKTDEIGAIARALLVFKENLMESKQIERQQKEREKESQEQRKVLMRELADKFEAQVKSIVQTVASASTQLAQTAEQMAGNVSQSSRMSQDAAVAASQTSSNVNTVAAAVEEMSASSKEISSQTQRSTQTVRESVTLTQEGDRSAAALQEAVDKVQNAVDIINTIAGQINLLALNATIESARAGEAGRGFAVVAGEVKHLASQTANATKEIANVLSEMNQASGDIIDVLSNIKSSINTVSDVAASIASAIEEQSATTGEIASNMMTASRGTDLISDNLGKVTESTLVVQDSSEQVLMAAKELSRQAETLDAEINSFLSEIRG